MRSFLKRHPLWLGFVVAVIPLVLLLVLQYLWLVKLQKTSAIAHKAYLGHYLEAVATRVDYFYRSSAERSLNVPAEMFWDLDRDEIAKHFKKKPIKGAREVFVLHFREDGLGKLLFYDRFLRTMVPKEGSHDVRAILAAIAPLIMLRYERSPLDSAALSVHEQDPDSRIIINPIVDDHSYLVGAAGIVVDESFFTEAVLPKEVEKSFKGFFGGEDPPLVTVRDASGELIYASGPLEESWEEDRSEDAARPFAFVFGDWEVGVRSRGMTPEQWAKVNFGMNMTLGVLLALILLGGLTLAFRAAGRELKLSQMKSTFVSNVSHELRTPLASIRVFAEFLRLGRVRGPEKVAEYGEYIETESRRLTQLINNILDFSKIESGAKTYHFESADLREIVADTLKTLEIRLRHTGFEVGLEAPDEPLPLVSVDHGAVRQALSNLLDNAAKYSGDSRRIVVRLGKTQDSVMVAVKDFGIGISSSEQKKIFERFHRVSTGLVHDVKGSGLGLSIVSHVVKAHGGKIRVKSEPGKGSTFTISLPVDSTATALPASEAERPDEPGSRAGGMAGGV
jgi:signal transduction histidine kinase